MVRIIAAFANVNDFFAFVFFYTHRPRDLNVYACGSSYFSLNFILNLVFLRLLYANSVSRSLSI